MERFTTDDFMAPFLWPFPKYMARITIVILRPLAAAFVRGKSDSRRPPRLERFTLSYQFGLMTISGIVPVSWATLLTLPARVRDNC